MPPGPIDAYLLPSGILIHPCVWVQNTNVTDSTDRQDRQRFDSIGRTVLQTVAQKQDKRFFKWMWTCVMLHLQNNTNSAKGFD